MTEPHDIAVAGSRLSWTDIIVAQATPPGRSAIAVVRLSGAGAHELARRHLDRFPEEPRRLELAAFRADSGQILDRCLVARFDAPHSYTGEDLVEISTHGGHMSPAKVMEQLVLSGARPAERGEFTRRAVLNAKIDLLQAEAIGDLIDAGSRAMHRAAVNQLDRGLSQRIEALRSSVLQVEALLAYDIDFPEEDDGPIPRGRIAAAAREAVSRMDALLTTAPAGELVREGAVVVIAGRPNVGKSSLFNAILGRTRAIVTDVPGTTRDAIEAMVEGARWPLRLVDTAGLRETSELVERLGVELSERHVRAADVVLACGDSDDALAAVQAAAKGLAPEAIAITVRTKADLAAPRQHDQADSESGVIAVSAHTGAGLPRLMDRIEEEIAARAHAPDIDSPILTRARHRAAIEAARSEMRAFLEVWEGSDLPTTVTATHLRAAVGALTELIGTIDVEDVLGRVFAEFCVGK